MAVHDYIRQRFFPHMWCPGCGHGIVLNALLHAVDGMGLDKKDLVMVSGIGCSARRTPGWRICGANPMSASLPMFSAGRIWDR